MSTEARQQTVIDYKEQLGQIRPHLDEEKPKQFKSSVFLGCHLLSPKQSANVRRELTKFIQEHREFCCQDIEREAGVNRGYCSRVLREKCRISDKYAKALIKASRKLSEQVVPKPIQSPSPPKQDNMSHSLTQYIEALRPSGFYYSVSELTNGYQSSHDRVNKWIRVHCPLKYKHKSAGYTGPWWMHKDALPLLEKYLADYDAYSVGAKKKSVSRKKNVVPKTTKPPMTTVTIDPRLSLWQRIRVLFTGHMTT